jgi:hypothetical protein
MTQSALAVVYGATVNAFLPSACQFVAIPR